MTEKTATWWSQPAGGREVFRLALPLVLSTASWAIMHFIDRLFLMWHSSTEMAAALPSGTLLWTVMALPLGIASYVNTFVAQYHGANEFSRIGRAVRHGTLLGWLMTPLFWLLIPLAPFCFRALGHDGELARLESIYFQISCLGAGPAVIAAAYSSFYTGRGQTAVVMWIDILASVVDAIFNGLWIFGRGGFPEWGIGGAAAATVLAQWLKVAIYWWLLRTSSSRSMFGFQSPWRLQPELLRRLLRYGIPNGFQMMLEGLAFTVFVIAIGQLGTAATAATTLAISINIVAFVPMMGVGIAVTTLVGNYLGSDRPDLAARASRSGLALALAYNLIFAILYLAVPHWFMRMHEFGAAADDFAAIQSLAIVMLRFVAAYCLFDATQLIFCSAIKGAGDTRFVMITTLVTSSAAVLLGKGGEWWLGGGILWWWSVLVVWIVALAAVYAARFWQGKWKQMRVIEPPVEDPAASTANGEGQNRSYASSPAKLAATGTDR